LFASRIVALEREISRLRDRDLAHQADEIQSRALKTRLIKLQRANAQLRGGAPDPELAHNVLLKYLLMPSAERNKLLPMLSALFSFKQSEIAQIQSANEGDAIPGPVGWLFGATRTPPPTIPATAPTAAVSAVSLPLATARASAGSQPGATDRMGHLTGQARGAPSTVAVSAASPAGATDRIEHSTPILQGVGRSTHGIPGGGQVRGASSRDLPPSPADRAAVPPTGIIDTATVPPAGIALTTASAVCNGCAVSRGGASRSDGSTSKTPSTAPAQTPFTPPAAGGASSDVDALRAKVRKLRGC
jgi:hypothetical protein